MTIINHLYRLVLAAILVATIVFTKTAFSADPIYVDAELVEFESVSYTYIPSPFKVRQAKKLGIPLEIKTEPSISLTGYQRMKNSERPSFSCMPVAASRNTKRCGLKGLSTGATSSSA